MKSSDAGLIDVSERGVEDGQALSRPLAQLLVRDLVQDEQAELGSLIGPGPLRFENTSQLFTLGSSWEARGGAVVFGAWQRGRRRRDPGR